MAGRAEARRAVDIQPDVASAGERRFTGVEAHPHPHGCPLGPRVLRQRPLRRLRRGDGIRDTREDREGGVALSVDDAPSTSFNHVLEESPVVVQHAGVGRAELLEQPCGPLDIGEEEGHRSGRERLHERTKDR